MTDAICVLDDTPRTEQRTRPRRLGSRKALIAELSRSKRHQVWVLRSEASVPDLIHAMSIAPPGVRRARLISYARLDRLTAQMIESGFERALMGARAMVALEDLEEILRAAHPEDYCVGAEWDEKRKALALWRGDLSVLVVPMSAFRARGGVSPDPNELSIEDCGQTVRMGGYEASVDAVLFERDALYRRRAKKRMLGSGKGLGASIRRLRILRGVPRTGFPGLEEKTLARIERGEVEHPQRATKQAIATRLGVRVEELGDF